MHLTDVMNFINLINNYLLKTQRNFRHKQRPNECPVKGAEDQQIIKQYSVKVQGSMYEVLRGLKRWQNSA
jgi:hypothetical protein